MEGDVPVPLDPRITDYIRGNPATTGTTEQLVQQLQDRVAALEQRLLAIEQSTPNSTAQQNSHYTSMNAAELGRTASGLPTPDGVNITGNLLVCLPPGETWANAFDNQWRPHMDSSKSSDGGSTKPVQECCSLESLDQLLSTKFMPEYQSMFVVPPTQCANKEKFYRRTRIKLRRNDDKVLLLDGAGREHEVKFEEWMVAEIRKGSKELLATVDVQITYDATVAVNWATHGLWVKEGSVSINGAGLLSFLGLYH